MNYYDLLLAKMMSGGGGGGNPDYSSFVDGSFSGVLDISSATRIKYYGVSYLDNVTEIKADNVEELAGYSVSNMNGIENVVFPSLKTMNSNAFRDSKNLEKIDLGQNVNSVIASTMFYGCLKLNVLVLRKNGVVGLNNINAFQLSPFASGGAGGTLYVPSAQISSYQSASNWTTILGYANNQIKAIEGSEYETKYVDGRTIGA